ncbi:hypothetical protein BpHYR1_046670 [Brachionus plicatilis]|uniref:Uncharacterized protein n=1 Tax=Brachionus plicatilis TaxID=10195 RepID=A0A3M7RW61_BRAPC|nr:hypothetical protein BpHYR1_046670 [Brachionus plicatilis]
MPPKVTTAEPYHYRRRTVRTVPPAEPNRTLGLIRRTFKYHNAVTISKLNKTFVRPQLKYGVQVWMLILKKDINKSDLCSFDLT